MSQDSQSCTGRDGPPFHETNVLHQVLTLRGQTLVPEITASIQKGFFQVDRKWTCYRRNYFAVQCAFNFRNSMAEAPLYLNKNGSEELIQNFAVSISAKTAVTTNGESETRGLVQHTPKREKATERVPGRQQIAPSHSHGLGPNGTYSSAGHMYPGVNHVHSASMGTFASFETPGANSPPTTYTFERIQFQKATANNGKRRAQQQYFLVVVELAANIGRQGHDDWVVIATKESDPMVVRGRSPGHYKDNGRRDSQASMDPDCGSGHGASAHPGALSSGAFGHGHPSVAWDGYGPNRHYGGSSYRHAANSRFSPASVVSATTQDCTTTDAELNISDSHTRKSSFTLSSDTSALTPVSEGSDDVMFSSLDRRSISRKRPLETDEEGDYLRYPLREPYTDALPSLPDFSTMAYSKLLCASS
ncbi:hypothetical protein A1O7_05525 [Cladophialophora yegresii CBS 114405]|uniref:NDT80 domain-containing protein n=1 Tax=Cladophialophora yegresii CBS 114405 TaxID=1182544 RepID=W9W0R7_9EURO|nr:uncharacterized protein A1O7_05525 [Cladophialophora yegresii CBS 114405]EXJ58101.1 hypothetical protein A1O7_05525 [Cladophialophora yegresii CBS 114405]